MKLNDAIIIQLPKNLDRRGNLSVVEEITNIPFEIKRTYWIYDVPGGEVRGGHAYLNNEEFIIALSGSFDVMLDDGLVRKTFSLNRSYYGLYVPKGVWRQMVNFSTNSLALIVASIPYDPGDYMNSLKSYLLRDYLTESFKYLGRKCAYEENKYL